MKNTDSWIIHNNVGGLIESKIITAEQVENLVKEMEEKEIKPCYQYDYGHHEYSLPGWLIWSAWDGAGVAVRYSNGNIGVIRGWQCEFRVI